MSAPILNSTQMGSDRLRKVALITKPQLPLTTQTSITTSQNTATLAIATPAFLMKVLDGPALIYSFAILADGNTTTNYSFQPYIGTTTNLFTDQNNKPLGFINFPTGGSINAIPEGTALYVPGGTTIALYVYNSNSATNAGVVNVSIALDQLGTGFDPSTSQL